ncbi:unnamed protein product [Rotaria sp. Silwood1]|nr:unnamed protein product [Rotaria sp. Silwood1]CAF1315875.1 unnamed protein product [Rotaria sp. Silwood1]
MHDIHRSVMYTLQSIEDLFSQYNKSEIIFIFLPLQLMNKLEEYLIELLSKMKSLKYSFDYNHSQSFSLTKPQLSSSKIINILLLDEINVGKSTFINAFINYIQYKTFERAELNKLIVLISVSFCIMINNNYEEHITRHSDFDNSNQSVTQYCKSYIFHFKDNDEIKLRFIDTPGFDDTQAKINMQYIFDYINNFLIFKYNTFYFDNASFRYLVAVKNGIQFDDSEKKKYEKSWSISIIESNRLFDYICKNFIGCLIPGKLQLIKHAQFEIMPMIRPMLETMRNILQYIIIPHMNSIAKSIEIHPKVIHRLSTICLMCKPQVHQVGDFWIVNDFPHEIQEICYTCSCPFNQHVPIDYLFKYELSSHSFNIDQCQAKELLSKLCYASAEFPFSFLMYAACVSKDDLFDIVLTKMIDEENNICLSQNVNHLNLQLVNELRKLKSNYEIHINDMKNNHQ